MSTLNKKTHSQLYFRFRPEVVAILAIVAMLVYTIGTAS